MGHGQKRGETLMQTQEERMKRTCMLKVLLEVGGWQGQTVCDLEVALSPLQDVCLSNDAKPTDLRDDTVSASRGEGTHLIFIALAPGVLSLTAFATLSLAASSPNSQTVRFAGALVRDWGVTRATCD